MANLRQKVKDSLDPYLEGEISDFEEDLSSDLKEINEDEDLLKELEDELKEDDSDSDDLEDWDKWSFSSKISPPSPKPHLEESIDTGSLRFDAQRSSHLWKSDPEVPEYRSFGSLREKNNNVLAANLRKYQNEILSGTA